MLLWQIFTIVGVVFLILEMFLPTMFFLNFAIGGFASAIFAYYIPDALIVTPIFVVVSLLCLVFLREVFLANRDNKDKETGVTAKYIGKKAKATSDITNNSGTISIYDERWDARSFDGEIIPSGSEVEIVNNDSLIMIVKKI